MEHAKIKHNIPSIYFEITNKCNLFCKHCYNNSGNKNNSEIEPIYIENLFADMQKNGLKNLSLSGGEPLLHSEIKHIVKTSKKYGIDLKIITNGTLLDKYIDFLYENNIKIQISIDGSTPKIHNIIRGNGSFEKMESNLKLAIKKGAECYLKSTINYYNADDVEKMILYAIDKGASMISFSFTNNIGRTLENKDLCISFKKQFDLLEKFKQYNKKYKDKIYISYPEFSNGRCPWNNKKTSDDILKISPRIDVEGNMFLCNAFMDKKYSIGNIKENDLYSILTGEKLYNLLDYIYLRQFYAKCEDCFLLKGCGKGCPGEAMSADIINTDDYCVIRKANFIKEQKQILSKKLN